MLPALNSTFQRFSLESTFVPTAPVSVLND